MQIPDYYEFLNQAKIISGKKAMEHIPFELRGYDAQKPLVVTSRALSESGLIKKFIGAFKDSAVTLGGIFNEVRDYAGIGLARDAAFLYKERGCDSIIAVGNGPEVDVAKAVNILVAEKTDDLFRYFDGTPLKRHLKPLIVVPACCSSGMEFTNTVTVDNRSLTSNFLYPDLAIIDPRMTPAKSRDCVAEASVIALAHAVGTAVTDIHSPMIEAYAHSALRYLGLHMARGLKKPGHVETSLALHNAYALASLAFSNTPTGMVHLLAVELARATDISAGKFMRILLPYKMAHMIHKKMKIRDELFLALAGYDEYAATPAKDRSKAGVERVLGLLAGLKGILPETMKELKVPKYRLGDIAKAASARSAKRYSEADCRMVLEHAWEGRAF